MHGRDLARRAKKTSPAQRAALAARLARGEVSIAALTTMQTAMLTHLHVGSVSLAKNASDDDLAALRSGQLSLRALRVKRRAEHAQALAERAQAAFDALAIKIDAFTSTQVAAE